MTAALDIALIVVNYRTAPLTIQCVESLLRSRHVRPHVFIIDNASPDESVAKFVAEWAEEPRVSVHPQAANGGYTGGANAGFALARKSGAGYAVLFNSDTIVDPDCVRRLMDEAETDDRVALVNPCIFFGDQRDLLWFGGGRFSLWTGRPVHVGFRRHPDAGWPVARDESFATGCALLVRLDALGAQGFDPSLFAYAEDLDLSLRLRAAGFRCRYAPGALVWHYEGSSHRQEGGESLRFYLTTRNLLRVVARHARWYHWITLAPMLAIDVVARFCVTAALRGDRHAFAAVLRGAWHALSGGRSPIEPSR